MVQEKREQAWIRDETRPRPCHNPATRIWAMQASRQHVHGAWMRCPRCTAAPRSIT